MKKFVKLVDGGRQWVCFPPEVPMDEIGKSQCWYIWRPSNKRTNEGPNVWRSTERSRTVHKAVTEVSSYKLPEKPPECWIREGNWRATEEFPLTRGANVKLHFLLSKLYSFPKNCGDLSEEQGEHFHQDSRIKKEHYQGRWNVNFLDNC